MPELVASRFWDDEADLNVATNGTEVFNVDAHRPAKRKTPLVGAQLTQPIAKTFQRG